MNFGQAFTFPFEDPDWAKKIIIPALIGLIPLVGQIFLLGWGLTVTRRVINRDPNPLPDLDFGAQLSEGFRGFVVGLAYALPIILISIPMNVVWLAGSSGNMDENTLTVLGSIVSVCCSSVIFIYSLALAMVVPAALGNMIAKGSLSAAFRFSEIIALVRSNPGAYLLVLAGTLLANLVGSLGVIACGVGLFLTYAYAMAINGHLYGQAYNQATRDSGYAKIY